MSELPQGIFSPLSSLFTLYEPQPHVFIKLSYGLIVILSSPDNRRDLSRMGLTTIAKEAFSKTSVLTTLYVLYFELIIVLGCRCIQFDPLLGFPTH